MCRVGDEPPLCRHLALYALHIVIEGVDQGTQFGLHGFGRKRIKPLPSLFAHRIAQAQDRGKPALQPDNGDKTGHENQKHLFGEIRQPEPLPHCPFAIQRHRDRHGHFGIARQADDRVVQCQHAHWSASEHRILAHLFLLGFGQVVEAGDKGTPCRQHPVKNLVAVADIEHLQRSGWNIHGNRAVGVYRHGFGDHPGGGQQQLIADQVGRRLGRLKADDEIDADHANQRKNDPQQKLDPQALAQPFPQTAGFRWGSGLAVIRHGAKDNPCRAMLRFSPNCLPASCAPCEHKSLWHLHRPNH